MAEYVHVKGDRPVGDASYWKASCRDEAIAKAKWQLRIDGEGHIGWIFLVARVEPDGRFQVAVERPARADGQFRILFCFDNGMVTGNGVGVVFANRGAIRKGYKLRNDDYLFGD